MSWFDKLCGRPPQYVPAPCKLTFDLLTLKVVSESRMTLATSVSILVFLGLSVLDLGPMYASDRHQTDVRRASSLNASILWWRGHNNYRSSDANIQIGFRAGTPSLSKNPNHELECHSLEHKPPPRQLIPLSIVMIIYGRLHCCPFLSRH